MHTPGPWMQDGRQITCDSGIHIIAECSEWLPEFEQERRANAKLIAAAPEILEIVRVMARFDGRNNNAALKQMAKDALAKIE